MHRTAAARASTSKRAVQVGASASLGGKRFAHKELKFSNEGRAAMLAGVDILGKAVSVTLGPKGRNVIIEQPYGGPKITKDGVTVAKAVTLKDKFENLGARLVQDVANKTNEVAGDGTTTATVLARAIYAEGVKHVASGCNPMDLRRGSQKAVDTVVKFLETQKRSITTSSEIAQVATISANGDAHVGSLIAKAMERVGREGVITVKEGKTIEDEIETTEGMKFDRGYISPYFVTDTKTQKTEFEKPLILLSEKKISLMADVLPALEVAAQARRPLLIVAEDVDGEALAACILNRLRGQLQVAAVKAPGFGDNRKSILGDLAILTGGTVFNDETDIKLDRLTPELLGSSQSVTVTKEDTILLNGDGSKNLIHDRCEQIRALIDDAATSDYDRTKLQERLAKLSGGVAVIRVGGSSEVEVGEKKDRYDDALNATRAAVEEGVVPGGGIALLKASLTLKDLKGVNHDQNLGIEIIRKALVKPARTIIDNAGEDAPVIAGQIIEKYADKFNMGYDAQKGEYVDMLAAGILDPLKVVRTALIDAAGVASLLTTSEACIVEAPEEKAPNPAAGMGGMGGGMGF